MNDFSIRIQTSTGSRVFMFYRLHFLNRIVYRVVVFGRVTNNYFTVEHDSEDWKFIKPEAVADWVKEGQDKLSEALDDHYLS